MKVAIVGTLGSSVIGFRKPLILDLIDKGHDVFVFAIDFDEKQKLEIRSWGVVPIDYQLSRSGINPFSDLVTIYSLKKKFELIEPNIVFSYFVKPVIYSSIAAWFAKVPKRIALLEGLGFAFTQQPEGNSYKTIIIKYTQIFLYRLVFPTVTHLFFLNPDDKSELLNKHKIFVKKSSVLGGIGLDLIEFPYLKPNVNSIRFLFIGRLLKEKGIFDFLAAAKIVKKQFPNVDFIVLGSKDSTSPNALSDEELQSHIHSGLICYPGQVSNVLDWIQKCSVFVLPSYREGVPRSSQEAMAVGRPILTTDVPGCKETVINNENGFLVPSYNVDELVNKMIWFIEHKEFIEKMGLASRKIAEVKFDVKKVNSLILDVMDLN